MNIATKIKNALDKQGRSLQVMDIEVYDKIAARYGDNQPRGGVVFNAPLSLVSCDYLTVDTYGRGDIGNIIHGGGVLGFASKHSSTGKRIQTSGHWNRPMPFPANMATIVGAFKKARHVKLGVNSDPFAWMDRKYRVTLEFLHQALNSPIQTLVMNTRSDLVACDEYLEVLKQLNGRMVLAVVIHVPSVNGVALDDQMVRLLEPGCASVARRMVALKALRESGISAHIHLDEVAYSTEVYKATGLTESEFNQLNLEHLTSGSSNVIQLKGA